MYCICLTFPGRTAARSGRPPAHWPDHYAYLYDFTSSHDSRYSGLRCRLPPGTLVQRLHATPLAPSGAWLGWPGFRAPRPGPSRGTRAATSIGPRGRTSMVRPIHAIRASGGLPTPTRRSRSTGAPRARRRIESRGGRTSSEPDESAGSGAESDRRERSRRPRPCRTQEAFTRSRRRLGRRDARPGLVLLAGAVAGYGWYLNHEIHRIDLKNLTSAPVRGRRRRDREHLDDRLHRPLRAQGPEPRLRPVLAGRQRGQQRRRDDPAPQPGHPPLSILSIPRDLFVPNARKEGANKIDAALYEGPDQLIAAIEEDFGIPIQHFVELNFDSFINVVNALGGIKMYFPEPVYDAYSGLNIQTTGCIALNGTQALQVVRARHLQYKGPGVTTTNPRLLAPGERERPGPHPPGPRVPPGAGLRGQGQGPGQPHHRPTARGGRGRAARPWTAASRPRDMIGLVLGYHSVDVNTAPAADRAGGRRPVRQLRLQGWELRGHRVPRRAPGPRRRRPVPRAQARTDDTYSGGQLPVPVHVTVSVLNGIGRLQPGHRHRPEPAGPGVRHRRPSATPPGRARGRDRRVLRLKTPANLAAAQRVADSMSGRGRSWPTTRRRFASAPRSPSSPARTSRSIPQRRPGQHRHHGEAGSGPVPPPPRPRLRRRRRHPQFGSGAFQAPTPAVEPLAPWDPRSCTASGGEGPDPEPGQASEGYAGGRRCRMASRASAESGLA